MSENFPYNFFIPLFLRMIWNTACDRDEWLFADVVPEVLQAKDVNNANTIQTRAFASAVMIASVPA